MARKNYYGAQFNQSPTIVEKAGADIDDVRNLIMKFDENGDVVPATAGTDMPVGIALIEAGYNDISGKESGKVVKGDDVDILVKDRGVCIAGADIKKGQEVAAGANGMAVVAAAGDYVLGVAMDAAATGEYLTVQITKYQKGAAASAAEEGTV